MEARGERGPYFEDFRVGQKIRHDLGRTITEVDNIWFTLLTCNSNQIHFNTDYTKRNFSGAPFRGRLAVNAYFVLSTVVGLSTGDTSRNGIMLGEKGFRMLRPVFSGDTLYAETTVLSKRRSGSRRDMGIVELRTEGFNQDAVKVTEVERTVMVRKKGGKWA